MTQNRALAVFISAIIITSMVAPLIAVGSAAAVPSGMSTIPDTNVGEDVPSGETIPLSASELRGGVMASQHADSLEVTLTTADHASSVMNADSAVVSGDGMAVVLRDDVESGGRRVALDAGLLQQALGYEPKAIYGTHEDGSKWTASAEYVDGFLVFDVPHFSSNTVTFSGEVQINATGATNNTAFQYNISSSPPNNTSVEIVGSENTQHDTISATGATNGDTISYSVGGNTPPRNATVSLTGKRESAVRGPVTITDSGSATVDPQGNSVEDATVTFTGQKESKAISASKPGIVGSGSLSADVYGTETVDLQLSLTGSKRTISETSFSFLKLRAQVPDGGTAPLKKTETDTIYTANRDGNYKMTVDLDGTADHEYNQVLQFYYEVYDSSSGSWSGRYTIGGKGFSGPKTFDITLGKGDKIRVTRHVESWAPGYYSEIPSGTYTVDRVSTQETVTGSLAGTSFTETVSDGSTTTTTVSVSPGGTKTANIDATNGLEVAAELSGTEVTLAQNPSLTVDGETVSHTGTLADGETITKNLNGLTPGSHTADASVSGVLSTSIEWTDVTETRDPSVSVGTSTVSHTGVLGPGETVTEPVNLTTGTDSATVTATGPVDVSGSWTEVTQTTNPSVTINGVRDSYTGTLANGQTTSLSIPADAIIKGSNTVTVNTDTPPTGPAGLVGLNYSHPAQDKITTTYQSSTFEEKYNISHTYADATKNAQVTIPFASDRVVGVRNVEYRTNGGAWETVLPANYRLYGTTLDVYLDDATGGVQAGQTVDVRATARKISVDNGQVTVTDPTAPGEPLDTELRVDSKSPDFAVNVGPTANGERVHYAYSPYFPTEDYVIIKSNGDQDLHLPNAVTGDRFRVRNLDTRVIAKRGDVRIDVVKAGENPELDVSPGPGGSGDPVTVEYYNTETGVKYLLNSLSRSIVVDSDVAQSPAIFEDDDSEDRWAILADSGVATSTSGGGGIMPTQVTSAASSVSLPLGDSIPTPLLLVGVLGLGAVVVFRRLNPFSSGSSTTTPRPSSRNRSPSSGSGIPGLRGVMGFFGSIRPLLSKIPFSRVVGVIWDVLFGIFSTVARVVWNALRGAGGWLAASTASGARSVGGWVAARLATPAIALGVIAIGVMAAVQAGIIAPPREVRLMLAAISALIGSAVALRAVGLLNWRFYGIVAGATFVIVAETLSPGSVLNALGSGLEQTFPIFGLVIAYLVYRRVRGGGGDNSGTTVVVTGGDSGSDSSQGGSGGE